MNAGKLFGFLILSALLVATGFAVSHYYYPPAPKIPSSKKTTKSTPTIKAQGRLEPITGTLSLSAIPGEEIAKLKVHIGQTVAKGDSLAVLGSYKLRQEELALARKRLEQASDQLHVQTTLGTLRQRAAELAVRQATGQNEVFAAQQKAIAAAGERLALAQKQHDRLKSLRQDTKTEAAVSETDEQQQGLLVQQLAAELEQNQAKLEAARQTQNLAIEAANLEKETADTTLDTLPKSYSVAVLQQSVCLADTALKASKLVAPCDGTILEIFMRQGERIATTPVLQMGDIRRIVCVAEVHESQLSALQVKPDDTGRLIPTRSHTVEIQSTALPSKLSGTIVEVSRMIGSPALRDPNPLARSDRRTAEVRIELDDESTTQASLYIHLQVDVTITLDP